MAVAPLSFVSGMVGTLLALASFSGTGRDRRRAGPLNVGNGMPFPQPLGACCSVCTEPLAPFLYKLEMHQRFSEA